MSGGFKGVDLNTRGFLSSALQSLNSFCEAKL